MQHHLDSTFRRAALLCGAALLLLAVLVALPLAADKTAAPSEPSVIHVATPDGGVDAFVAWPAGKSSVPAVIVVHEWWGLNDQIREVARRLARQGYLAVVPDLYHGKVANTPEEAHELVRGLEDTRVFAEMDSVARWIRLQKRSEDTALGVMGFCVGGGITLRYALHNPSLAAAVMFYGPPETDPAKLATLKAPLLGHFGATDQGITPDRVDAFREALKKSGKTASIYIYPGAGHAFMHDGAPSYHPDAARVAWARTLSFMQEHLKE
jgi:carboxymethylenebutenolidase